MIFETVDGEMGSPRLVGSSSMPLGEVERSFQSYDMRTGSFEVLDDAFKLALDHRRPL